MSGSARPRSCPVETCKSLGEWERCHTGWWFSKFLFSSQHRVLFLFHSPMFQARLISIYRAIVVCTCMRSCGDELMCLSSASVIGTHRCILVCYECLVCLVICTTCVLWFGLLLCVHDLCWQSPGRKSLFHVVWEILKIAIPNWNVCMIVWKDFADIIHL